MKLFFHSVIGTFSGFIRWGLLGVILMSVHLMGEVTLPASISSKMVIQREMPVPIWGLASAGEEVTVAFNGQTVKATANADGKWMVKLAPMKEGGPFSMTITGQNTVVIEDVLIGEVWFCSGQSNMAFTLKNDQDAEKEIPQCKNPDIRFFVTDETVADSPQFTVKGKWSECNPKSVGSSSAIAYYFGKQLQSNLNVPIGLLQSAYGSGTSADAWMDKAILQKDPDFKPILDRWAQDVATYPANWEEYQKQKQQFDKASEAAIAIGAKPPKAPLIPRGKLGSRETPSGCFYGMLKPHVPYAIRGVIWYQGESNDHYGFQYRKLLPALIQSWREMWGEGEFPFLIVQLPNLNLRIPPAPPAWAEIREAQFLTYKNVINTALVTTIDIGDPNVFSFKNKRPVGERLAVAAMGRVYGKTDEWMGPIYKSQKVESGKIRLTFDHIGRGLTSSEGALKGFKIAGDDKNFFPAEAVIDGDTVVVSNFQTNDPVSVRYAWEDNPQCTLFNKEGLPASPFRTDDWPESTFNNR
ncbi:MAG: sialate O-acetylesterase [Verrucomicrobiota bacterium]